MQTPRPMRWLAALPVLAIWTATAAAEVPISIGVNSPASWLKDKERGFGASAYYGFGRHHAVRANYASYAEDGPSLAFIGEIMGGDHISYTGTIADLGLAYVWYPRRLWSGPTFELGVLRRARNTSTSSELSDTVETNTLSYAARGMIGWSWRCDYLYVAVAVGLSAGRERGHERIDGAMTTARTVDRAGLDTEGYLRIGVAFGR